jgi:hypothetical protein
VEEEAVAVKCIVILLSVLLALAGCASPGAAWISASKFDHREYKSKRVAVVPVAMGDLVDPATLPRQAVQDAIVDQLYVLDIAEAQAIEAQDAKELSFPYTPARLAKFGRDHDYDAVVGATIIRFDRRPARRQWSLTGNITFVDVDNPDRRWTIAKTWDMTGKPSGTLASFQLGTALLSDFVEVKRAVRRGSVSALMSKGTVVVDAGPIVNLDIVDVIVDPSNAVKQVVAAASAGSVPTRNVHVDVFAMDDAGIASLQLVNANAGFKTWVWGEPSPAKANRQPAQKYPGPAVRKNPVEQAAQKAIDEAHQSVLLSQPIYVAHRLPVAIAPGINDIQAIAINGKDQRVTRNIRVETEVSHDVPIDMMVIAATKFDSLPPASLSEPAAKRFEELSAREGSSFRNGARVVTFTGAQASRSSVVRNITLEWARPAAGSRRVLAFMGRAEMFIGRPYFILSEAAADYPEIGSMSLDDLLSLMDLGVASATLDLCTNDSPPAAIETAIKALGDPRIKIAVGRDCQRPVGQLFVNLETAGLDDD